MKLSQRLLVYSRQWHRWGAIVASAPLLLTILTGLLLLHRGHVDWIQPQAHKGEAVQVAPAIGPEAVLEILKTRPEAEVSSWKDVSQMIYRPGRGTWQVRVQNHHEVQIDGQTGAVLHSRYRTSTLLIQLHEGSFFGKAVMYWVFFPAGLLLLSLWLTGIWLFIGPVLRRKKSRNKEKMSA